MKLSIELLMVFFSYILMIWDDMREHRQFYLGWCSPSKQVLL